MLASALVLIIASACRLEAVEINCEAIKHCSRFQKCCYLNGTTVIDELNVTIENSDVHAVVFELNNKIEFLPIDVYEKFPNLEVYLSKEAAVKEISALNFGRLSNLKLLDLESNQIEFIPDDCFQGLFKLHQIYLSTYA